MKPTMRVLIVSLLSISLTLALMLVLQANVPTALATGPWFVSPSGDNDNSCLSPDFACMTIQAAINKAS